ncbi:MAG TPA: hypothetical protein VMH04_20800 [Candidatus Solibacter sp.]|nr:hypothetical protein [Candidatus Solibacter sp.]
MFEELYDLVSRLGSWRWPVVDGRVTEVLGERIEFRNGEKRARLAVAYEFSVGDNGPYTGECFWTPLFMSVARVAQARKLVHKHQAVRVRYRPDDPCVNSLAGGVAGLLRTSQPS